MRRRNDSSRLARFLNLCTCSPSAPRKRNLLSSFAVQTPAGATRTRRAAAPSRTRSSGPPGWSTSTAPFGTSTPSCRRCHHPVLARHRTRCATCRSRRSRPLRRARRRPTTRHRRAIRTCAPALVSRALPKETGARVWRAQDAEDCIPLPRLSDYGLDVSTDAVVGAVTEERAACLFVRRILDARRRASSCFSHVASPTPPPPPERVAQAATGAASLRRQRERLGDLEVYAAPRKTDAAQWSADTGAAIRSTDGLLGALGERNPVLQSLLATARDEIVAATGRRLLQRTEYNVRMTDALVTHELMAFYGNAIPHRTPARPLPPPRPRLRCANPAFRCVAGTGGVPGVTVGSCQARNALEPCRRRPRPTTPNLSHCAGEPWLRRRCVRPPSRTSARSRRTSAVRSRSRANPARHTAPLQRAHSVVRRVRLQARRALLVHGQDGLVLPLAGNGGSPPTP